jgi:DNA mismatch repair ATPase MutS
VVRQLYAVAVEAIEGERKIYRYFRSPDGILHSSGDVLALLMTSLAKIRRLADDSARSFASEGFGRFFRTITTELDDEYFRVVDDELERLRFRRGVLISAELGPGNTGVGYVLRRPRDARRNLRTRLRRESRDGRDTFTVQIPEHDESGVQALTRLRDQGINLVANAVAQATDHILGFIHLLRSELAFYLGCLNLHDRLTAKGEPLSFPALADPDRLTLTASGLYDPCLSLRLPERAVGNDLQADGRSLIIITGANQGGKSTALRSIGVAQLMLQAGMFVPAESFEAGLCAGVFTHFQREEDPTMSSGKLDEELARMSDLINALHPRSLVLCNESFASTNEREGSDLALAIVRALTEAGIRVVFVTHLFQLADTLSAIHDPTTLFLRADRSPDGHRSFKLTEAAPQPTSHGEDLYQRIFPS